MSDGTYSRNVARVETVLADHGFIFVRRNAKGAYEPDPAQRQIMSDTIAYFNSCLR